MKRKMACLCLSYLAFSISPATLMAQEYCIPPAEPYLYEVDKTHDREFYDFSRSEFQTYLESMEAYLRCLEAERSHALHRLGEHFKLFQDNYGSDAVFKSGPDNEKDG